MATNPEGVKLDPADVDLMNPEIQACPFDAYQKLRDDAPAYKMPDLGMYVVSRYEDLKWILRNTSHISMKKGEPLLRTAEARKVFEDKGLIRYYAMVEDPPVHSNYRGVVDKAFTAGRIRKMVPQIEAIVDELIDDFPDGEDFDFVPAFSVPLPTRVIAVIMGLPSEDLAQIKEWSDFWLEVHSFSASPEREMLVARKGVEFQEYLWDWLERKKQDPAEDVLTDIAFGKVGGKTPLTKNEMISLAEHVLVGGNETTTNGLALAMRLMIEEPGTEARLKDDPSLIETFVEESLRLQSPTQGLERRVIQDMELHGQHVPEGSILHVRYAAANRDERFFDEPDKLDLNRKNAAAHMAFGQGIHHCLGAPLARQEMNSAFERLLARKKNFALCEGKNSFDFVETLALRIPKDLWIRCEAQS